MKYLIILSTVLTLFSCERESISNTNVVMTYQMTQCADPWMGADFNQNKSATLRTFLTGKGIQVMSLSVQTDCTKSAVCLACTCAGCDFATVEVAESDVAKMEALKFKRQ